MLVFVAARGHDFPVHSLVNGRLGTKTPPCIAVTYESLFCARQTANGVHIFLGIDQLYDWELLIGADLCRALRQAGLVCLNDPARAMGRFELLRALHDEGINAFDAYRADSRPRPARFPVFIRREYDHRGPMTELIEDQAALDRTLADFREKGRPLRGLLVTEFCGEPVYPGIWHKTGTFRIGDNYHIAGSVLQDHWNAKMGVWGLATDEMIEAEGKVVVENKVSEAVRKGFELSGIEWGRADHTTVRGREAIYEINTNPWIYRVRPMPTEKRAETMQLARERFARLLWELDAGDGSPVAFEPSYRMENYRRTNGDAIPAIRS